MGYVQTYSFADLNFTFNLGSVGNLILPPYSLPGTGIVNCKIDPGGDIGSIDVAADGGIMITKKKAPHRNFSITIQQVSPLQTWLNGAYNLMDAGPSSTFASMSLEISSVTGLFVKSVLTNGFFKETAGIPFSADGEHVTWNLIFANGNIAGSVLSAITGVQAQILSNI